MPSGIAEFFASLPPWAQGVVTVAIATASVIVAWKGIIPHFIHEVPVGHRAVLYCRNVVVERNGEPIVRGPGYYLVVPALLKYMNTDVRQQTTEDHEGFKVDLGTPPMTYNVSEITINWHVDDPYKYQTGSADSERYIREQVAGMSQSALLGRNAPMSSEEITQWCKWSSAQTHNLTSVGATIDDVILFGSFDTRNHRFPIQPPSGAAVAAFNER